MLGTWNGEVSFLNKSAKKMQILELRIPIYDKEREREEKLYHCERKKK